MRNLVVIVGAALLMSMAGCAYSDRTYVYPDGYYRPVAHDYYYQPYDYGYRPYGYDGRSNAHG